MPSTPPPLQTPSFLPIRIDLHVGMLVRDVIAVLQVGSLVVIHDDDGDIPEPGAVRVDVLQVCLADGAPVRGEHEDCRPFGRNGLRRLQRREEYLVSRACVHAQHVSRLRVCRHGSALVRCGRAHHFVSVLPAAGALIIESVLPAAGAFIIVSAFPAAGALIIESPPPWPVVPIILSCAKRTAEKARAIAIVATKAFLIIVYLRAENTKGEP